jgi:hypothetical protein
VFGIEVVNTHPTGKSHAKQTHTGRVNIDTRRKTFQKFSRKFSKRALKVLRLHILKPGSVPH